MEKIYFQFRNGYIVTINQFVVTTVYNVCSDDCNLSLVWVAIASVAELCPENFSTWHEP